jgi:hypothetical protein
MKAMEVTFEERSDKMETMHLELKPRRNRGHSRATETP